MGTDGVVAYSAVEVRGSTEVVGEPGSEIVRCIVNPIFSTVRVDVALLPVRFGISCGKPAVEPAPPLLSRRTLVQRWRFRIGRVTDGLRVNFGFFMTGSCFLFSSRPPRVTSIGSLAIGLFLISPTSGTWLIQRAFLVCGITFRILSTRSTAWLWLWLIFPAWLRGR
jgi:hypothetical protein